MKLYYKKLINFCERAKTNINNYYRLFRMKALEFICDNSVKKSAEGSDELLDQVLLAQKDWQTAVHNFNSCCENDMIDYLIYNLEAAEKKYSCLLDRAKKQNINVIA